MLVSMLLAPVGVALGVLMTVLIGLEDSPLNHSWSIRIAFVVIYNLTFGAFSFFLLYRLFRRCMHTFQINSILYQVITTRKLLLSKYWFLLHVLITLGFFGLWTLMMMIKITELSSFLMTKFSIVALFSLAFGTICSIDRLNLSTKLTVTVVVSLIAYVVCWNVTRATNNNSCSDDSVVVLVGFFFVIQLNRTLLELMMILVCCIALYEEGFNSNNCPRLSPFLKESLLSRCVNLIVIGLTVFKLGLRQLYGPQMFEMPPVEGAPHEANDAPSIQNIVLQHQQEDRLVYLQTTKFTKAQPIQEGICSICTQTVKMGESEVILKCHHEYHFECIKLWFRRHSICPLCRQDPVAL